MIREVLCACEWFVGYPTHRLSGRVLYPSMLTSLPPRHMCHFALGEGPVFPLCPQSFDSFFGIPASCSGQAGGRAIIGLLSQSIILLTPRMGLSPSAVGCQSAFFFRPCHLSSESYVAPLRSYVVHGGLAASSNSFGN